MPSYRVIWEIDIETEFDSPREAAERAQAAQRHPTTMATVFTVVDDETGCMVDVDLSEEDLPVNDNEALLAIQELIDGVEWTSTLGELTNIVRKAGYRVLDTED